MHKMMAALLAGLLCASVAQAGDGKAGEKAATPAPPKVTQALMKKMRDCRTEAKKKQLKGDERTIWVSRCIDGSDARPRIAAYKREEEARKKREQCFKKAMAYELKGDKFEKFLAECRKG